MGIRWLRHTVAACSPCIWISVVATVCLLWLRSRAVRLCVSSIAALVAVAFISIVLLRVGIVLPVALLTRLGTVTLVLHRSAFNRRGRSSRKGMTQRVRSPARDD